MTLGHALARNNDPTFKLLVCDLDNTLYDWVRYFVPSFYAMVETAAPILNNDVEALLDDLREVHRFHHDSEHPFALLETKAARRAFPGDSYRSMAKKLDDSFHQFNLGRKHNLRLYDGVREGLEALKGAGVALVAHTESKLYGALDRLDRLELNSFFSAIYCRERPASVHPDPKVARRWLERFPMEKVVELSQHQRKPSPVVLTEICERQGFSTQEAAYVGDSIPRDVMMAKEAGVFAIWAKYGTDVPKETYDRLVRVSHWTPEDVEREIELKQRSAGFTPDFTATSFTAVVDRVLLQENMLS